MIRVEQLDNQTSLVMEPVTYTGTVSIGFWFLMGSRDEDAAHQGYTHFLEHMLFKGTTERSAFQIAREIDRVGGMINAYTDKENSCYYCTVPCENLNLALEILVDMLFHSVLDKQELEKEKSVILNEIAAIFDSPEDLAYEEFIRGLWQQHPLAARITGESIDVAAITREKLAAFYLEKYIHARMIIAIAGNFDCAALLDTVGRLLQKVVRKPVEQIRTAPAAVYGTEFRKSRFSQVQIYAGTQLPVLKSLQDYYVMLTISTIIGESLSSRLFQKIREEKGLCYSIYTFRSFYSDVSLWMIYSSTSPEYVLPLLRTVNDELAAIRKQGISAEEITDAASHLKGNLILAREDMETRMKRLARLLQFSEELIEYEAAIEYIDKVTRDTANYKIEEMLQAGRFRLFTFGNKQKMHWKGFRFTF